MSEERLKEIKDSIDIGVRRTTDIDWYASERVVEELELYNEVVRLREIIDNIKEELSDDDKFELFYADENINTVMTLGAKYYREYLLNEILKQNNLTLEQLTGVDNA